MDQKVGKLNSSDKKLMRNVLNNCQNNLHLCRIQIRFAIFSHLK